MLRMLRFQLSRIGLAAAPPRELHSDSILGFFMVRLHLLSAKFPFLLLSATNQGRREKEEELIWK